MIQMVYRRGSLQIFLIILLSFLLASCSLFDNDDQTTYSVGGTVSGLSGILELQNNGADNLKIAEDGKFAFSQQLEYLDPYNVTVLSQPVDQTCTVTNGAGTIKGTTLNIEVECSNNFPTFTVGGTVSGLSGIIELQNNGADDLTITTNGDFTFQTGLEDGKDYAVTILNQPTGQTCTVTNGSGTINAAAVTNVQIACATNPTPTYTVGGSVSGLSGTLVLQNNGGDNETITADGGFTFNTAMNDGAAYSVTVSSQPTGQTCNSANGSGTVNAANITSVTVTCINNPAPSYTVGGSVSGLADSATLVLQNNGGDNETITANGPFTFDTELTGGSAYSVAVFTQPAGQTCSVTNASGTIGTASVKNVQVACADNPTTTDGWSHPQSFNDGIVTVGGFAERFQVAMANNGEAVISYVDEIDEGAEGSWLHVFLSEKRDGSWHHPTSLNEKIDLDRDVSGNGGLVLFSGLKPQVAMADNGDTVITWNQENQFGLDSIYMAEVLQNGAMILPGNFDDRLNVGNYQSNNATPQVSMAGNGDTIIVWDQSSSSANRSFRKERRGGTWTVPTVSDYFTPADASSIPVDSILPQVAIADSGDTVITWQQRISFNTNNERQVLRSDFFDGGPWDDPASYQDYINPTEPDSSSIERGYAIAPRVAISSNGDAIIVWRQNVILDTSVPASPQRLYLFMSEYDGNTNTWKDPQDLTEYINLDTGYHAQDYQVAMDDNGNAIIVWEQGDATYSHIYMLQKSGGSWGASPVDISPDGPRPQNPQIAMAGNGDAVIIWTQDDNETPSSAYHQLFMSEYRNGSWIHPTGLSDYISLDGSSGGDVGNNEVGPHLAMNDSGDTIIVWKQYDPNSDVERLFISEYNTFGDNGVVVHDNAAGGSGHDSGAALALDSQGNIFVTGPSINSSGNYDVAIWKYTSTGSLDPGFGIDGIVVAGDGVSSDVSTDIALDSQGRIVVSADIDDYQNIVIARFLPDGTPDPAFGPDNDGVVFFDGAAGSGDRVYALTVDSSDNIYVTGYSGVVTSTDPVLVTPYMLIAKYDSNGDLDTSFGTNGIVQDTTNFPDNGTFGFDIALDSSGNIYVTGMGRKENATNQDMITWKYTSAGVLDTTFGNNGVVVSLAAAGGADEIENGNGITLDGTGNIYVAGRSQTSTSPSNYSMVIWKYTSAGVLDTSFGGNGIVVDSGAAGLAGNDNAWAVTVDSLGNVYAVGYGLKSISNFAMIIWKYDGDGVLDPTFGEGGIIVDDGAAGGSGSDIATDIKLNDTGDIFVTGSSVNSDGNQDMVIWKY